MSEEKYKQLIESIELTKIELESLESNKNRSFGTEKGKNIDIAIRSNVIETKYEELELGVQIEFEVMALRDGEERQDLDEVDDDDILFKIHFVLYLGYELELGTIDSLSTEYEDEVEKFVERNVPINAWPYARETVSSITTRMGLPPLIIPTFKNLGPL